MITSASNAQIRKIEALLKKSKERRMQNAFVIEGKKMFEEVLQRKELLIKAYFSEQYVKEEYPDGVPKELPHEILSASVFLAVSETVTPQGVLAIVRMPEYSLEEILEKTRGENGGTLLLLENVRDPGNLGTMIRTAEAADIAGIVLSRESVDVYNPKVIRSTMGAVFRVPVLYAEDFYSLLGQLTEDGVRLFAAHLKGTKDFTDADYTGRVGILIGNEANGLTKEASLLAKEKVLIPMAGSVESLNAAVAAALLMYEAFRKKRIK